MAGVRLPSKQTHSQNLGNSGFQEAATIGVDGACLLGSGIPSAVLA
jgi:hypothetical protein